MALKILNLRAIVVALAVCWPVVSFGQSVAPVLPYTSGKPVTGSNPLPVTGTFSATLSGFTGNGSYATLTATGSSSSSTALPTGTTTNISNTGTTAVSCTFATGSATGVASNIVIQPGSSKSRANGAFDHIACIDQTGSVSNVVVLEGGSGLGNDSGGGGSGGGAVTLASGAVASGAYSSGAFASGAFASGSIASGAAVSGAFVDGAIATLGTEADAAWVSGNGTAISLLKNIATGVASVIPTQAPTVSIGGVGIVDSAGTNVATVKAASTLPAATDKTLVVGLNPGTATAGSPSGAIVTVQGVASMTPFLSNPGTAANWGVGATGAAAPANGVQITAKASGATGGYSAGLIQCDNHTFKHITSATDTLAVQGVTSQVIYVCGWRARAAGVATWYLETTNDTNANCNGTKAQINGVATEAANTGEVAYNPIWGGLKTTAAYGLCINSTGTGGVDVDIWYTQF